MTGWYEEDPRQEPQPGPCRCGHDETDHWRDGAHRTQGCAVDDCDCQTYTSPGELDPDEAYARYQDAKREAGR